MPIVHRFIFRIDFDISYEMLDQQGKILKILVDAENWSSVGEVSGQRTLKAFLTSPIDRKDFTIDPVTINGVYESHEGIELSKVSEHKTFNDLSNLLHKYCDEFKLHRIGRIGFRTYMFDDYGERYENALGKFWKNFNPDFLKDQTEVRSKSKDIGLIIEGDFEEQLSYRAHFGTFFEGDFEKMLKKADSSGKLAEKRYHISTDFDLYEKDINFQGLTLKKWMKDKWPHLNNFMAKLKDNMLGTNS